MMRNCQQCRHHHCHQIHATESPSTEIPSTEVYSTKSEREEKGKGTAIEKRNLVKEKNGVAGIRITKY